MMRNRLTASLAIAVPCFLMGADVRAEASPHHLTNGVIDVGVSGDLGGRVVSFGLAGQPNFLRGPDSPPSTVAAGVDANTGHVPYNGHEMWVGPQSQWWVHQNLNPARAAEKASWPPDPFLSLTKYTAQEKTAQTIALESPASPISGIQFTKRVSLVPGKPGSLKHHVSATNRRDQPISWDIWFNTRVNANTFVYVPVSDKADIRDNLMGNANSAPLVYTLADGVLSLDMVAPPAGKTGRVGKILLQPSHGWLAGFHGKQAFVIQFAHQPKTAIHPEQGQVELYNEYQPDDLNSGVLEMEVHAPYVALAPGQTMQASETWTMLPYKGAATRTAHIAFLRKNAKKLGLAM